MQIAFEGEVVPHTAVLIPSDEKGKPIEVGAGTLIVIGNKFFVVTCAHIGRKLESFQNQSRISFADYRNWARIEPKRFTDAKFLFPYADREKVLDVCAIDYPSGLLSPIEKARFLDISQITLEVQERNQFAFIGLPSDHAKLREKDGGHELVGIPLICRTKRYQGEQRPKDHAFETDIHLLLKEKRAKTRPACESILSELQISIPERPKLKGLSGAGVWAYTTSDHRKTVPHDFRLAAVEHTVLHGEFILCTQIGYALRLIYAQNPALDDPLGFYNGPIKTLTSKWS